ncbi:hypothetical protein [Desulfobacca acetoxidans]
MPLPQPKRGGITAHAKIRRLLLAIAPYQPQQALKAADRILSDVAAYYLRQQEAELLLLPDGGG